MPAGVSHSGSNPCGNRHRHRHLDDNDSLDSGYGGSSATISPVHTTRQYRHIEGTETVLSGQNDGLDERTREHWLEDNDSDYDPRDRFYLSTDENEYRGMVGDKPSSGSEGRREEGSQEDDAIARHSRRHHHHRRRPRDSRWGESSSSEDTELDSDRAQEHGLTRRSSRQHSDSPSRPDQARSSRRHSAVTFEREPSSPTRKPRRHSEAVPHTRRQMRESSPSVTSSSSKPTTRGSRTSRHENGSQRARRADSASPPADPAAAAWYRTFTTRLTNGVDMAKVRKVGLEAAAVAAVKVAVGTAVPWRQRIPKTIAVGLAAAVTDFLVARTGGAVKPKGMVGNVFARQLVEIALANLVVNPASERMLGRPGGGRGGGRVAQKSAGGVGRRR